MASVVARVGVTPSRPNPTATLAGLPPGCSERVPSVLILDIWLQGSELDGLGILEMVKKKYPHMPVIMISGHGNIETAVSAIKTGAYDFIEKPFKEDRLLLLCQLSQGELCVSDMEEILGIRQPTLSQQLGVLRNEGTVTTRREGKNIYYRVADARTLEVLALLYRQYCPEGEK